MVQDRIKIVAPSGAIDSRWIDEASMRLRRWGWKVAEGAHARCCCGRFAGTDAERLQDLNDAFRDTETDIILCARGGYGLQRIIGSVEPTNKTVVGFSDITALHQVMLKKGFVSLHGLMCKHIAELPEEGEELLHWREAISGRSLCYELASHPLNREGVVTGKVVGGNLSVLYGLQGTPWSLDMVIESLQERPILFIEDIAERHYHIDRMMQNLRLSGVLAKINGLIVGQFTDCDADETMGESIYETILRATEGYDFPILFDFPAGHVEHNLPLWLGKPTTLQVGRSVIFKQK